MNASGGVASNPANWLNGLVPGQDDIADITLAGTYTVTLDVDATISQLVMATAGHANAQCERADGDDPQRSDHDRRRGGVAAVGNAGGQRICEFRESHANQRHPARDRHGDGHWRVELDWWRDARRWQDRIAASATGTIGGECEGFAVNRVLENAGTLLVSGGAIFFNQSSFGGGAVINNLAGATLEAQGDVDFIHNFASPNSAINNAGLFRKTGGGETILGSSTVALNNTGTVEIVNGTLRLDGGGTNSGIMTSTVSGILDHRGGTFVHSAGAAVNLQGALTSSGGATTFTDPATALGTITVTGGDMTSRRRSRAAPTSSSSPARCDLTRTKVS